MQKWQEQSFEILEIVVRKRRAERRCPQETEFVLPFIHNLLAAKH